jgi:hypothetical protein
VLFKMISAPDRTSPRMYSGKRRFMQIVRANVPRSVLITAGLSPGVNIRFCVANRWTLR